MQCKSMNVKRRGLLAGACFAALLVAGVAGSAYAADYTPVTDARLANPEPGNWLMTRGNYKGWSYSALDQINSSNVKNLVPVWSFSTGVDSGHESPPIVNNGVMFVYDALQPGHRARCGHRRPAVALQAPVAGRVQRPAQHQPRRGAVRRQGLLRAARRHGGRARCEDRQGRLGGEGRGLEAGLLHDDGPADREGQSPGWRCRRRVRRARLRPGVRRADRQVGLEDLHRPGARRARQRHLEEGGHLEDGRRLHLDDRQLRSRHQHGLLGHRQRLRPGSAISGPATICTPPRRSRWMAIPARSRAISSTIRTSPGTGTR